MSKRFHAAALAALILFAAAVVFLSTANRRIIKEADNVSVVREAEYGDPSAAKGLKLISGATNVNFVRYQETIGFSESGGTVSVSHQMYLSGYRNRSVYDTSLRPAIRIRADVLLSEPLISYLQGVAAGMERGSSKVVTVRPADFMEYYPVFAIYSSEYGENKNTGSEIMGIKGGIINDYRRSINEGLSKLFRVPVDGQQTVEIELSVSSTVSAELSVKYAPIQINGEWGYPAQYLFEIASGCMAGGFYICSYTDYAKNIEGGQRIVYIPKEDYLPDGLEPLTGLATDAAEEICALDEGYSVISSYLTLDNTLMVYAGDKSSSRVWIVSREMPSRFVATDRLPAADKTTSRIFLVDRTVIVDTKGQPYRLLNVEGGRLTETVFPRDAASDRASGLEDLWEDVLMVDALVRDGQLCIAGKYREHGTASPEAKVPSGKYAGCFLCIYDSSGLRYYVRFADGLAQASTLLDHYNNGISADRYYLSLEQSNE